MIDPKQLQRQLREFNLVGYSDTAAEYKDNEKDGKIITLEKDEWKYEDEFYGGEPYSGNETVWYGNKAVFRCVYWGKVTPEVNFSDIYSFLKKALKEGPAGNCVHRGPENFIEEDLKYTNSCEGTIEEFVQIEKIFINDKEVYTAHFFGGRVNTTN